jgi:hypothetical protein
MRTWEPVSSLEDVSLVRWQRLPALMSVPTYAGFWEAWAFPCESASAPVLQEIGRSYWRARQSVYQEAVQRHDDRTAWRMSTTEAFALMFQRFEQHSAAHSRRVFEWWSRYSLAESEGRLWRFWRCFAPRAPDVAQLLGSKYNTRWFDLEWCDVDAVRSELAKETYENEYERYSADKAATYLDRYVWFGTVTKVRAALREEGLEETLSPKLGEPWPEWTDAE